MKLKDVTSLIGDGLHGSPKYDEKGNYYFINGNNLKNGKITFKNDTKMVDDEEFSKYKKKLTNKTLFISINGTIGNIAKYKNEKIILGKSACYLNTNEKIVCDYLFYILSSRKFQKYLLNEATGTTIKNVSLETIRNYELDVPSLEEQQKIADILSPIDEKIELNNEINKTLEDISQLLYKQWFIDFEFPNEEYKPYKSSGGKMIYNEELNKEIPEGWNYNEIKFFGNVITGKTPPTKDMENFGNEYPFITIPDMNDMFIISTQRSLSEKGNDAQKNKIIPKKSLCISCIATIGKVSINTIESHTNQQINSVILNDTKYLEYLYFVLSNMTEKFKLLGSGATTTSNINKVVFENIKILNPNEKIVKLFNKIVSINFQQILNNLLEIEVLKKQKEILLNKYFGD